MSQNSSFLFEEIEKTNLNFSFGSLASPEVSNELPG
jgi:hypothetical protein